MTSKNHALPVLALAAILGTAGLAWSADQSELDRFIRARIDIGEMMVRYFQDRGGMPFGRGQRPSPEEMKEMQEDINARLTEVLSAYDLTVDEYGRQSREVLGDEAAIQRHLDRHPDLKKRYEALPLDRMGRSGSGRGY